MTTENEEKKTEETKKPADSQSAAARFAADNVRGRERRRHAAMPAWQAVSFVVHGILIAALIWFTPLREIVMPDRNKPRDPLQMDPDKLESLASDLRTVRLNELLEQLNDLQTILHNMEYMRNEILRDYDEFASQQQGETRESVSKLLEKVIVEQEKTITEQATAQTSASAFTALQKMNIADTNVAHKIGLEQEEFNKPMPKIDAAQASAQNMLDTVAVQAELIGLKKTTQAAGVLRDKQLEANTMQRETQRNLANRVWEITTELPRASKAVTDLNASIEKNEANLAATIERLAKEKANAEQFAKEAADLAVAVEAAAAAQKAAQEIADKAQEKLDNLNTTFAEQEEKKKEV